MQALKGLVIGLGILIVVGFVLLIYGFYAKFNDPDFKVLPDRNDRASTATGEPASPPAQVFGETRIALPDGCTLVDMRPDGDRLYVRTGPAGLCERILVIDPATGEVLGTIVAKP